MKNVFSSPKVKTSKKQMQLVTTWVLPPFQTRWWHGGIPSFPTRRAAPGRQGLLLVLVPAATHTHTHTHTRTHPGGLATWLCAEQERGRQCQSAGRQFPPLLAVGPRSPWGFLRVALLGSLSWKCSPLITDHAQTFPLRPSVIPPLPSAFRSLHPSKLFTLFSLRP